MQFRLSTSGFTLVEMMVVITMIAILMSIATIPYGYYMDRARTERSLDKISQEWIIAHHDVRNGIVVSSGGVDHHAELFMNFELGQSTIHIFAASTGSTTQTLYRTFTLDKWVEILGFSGITLGTATGVTYHIIPPNAGGKYSTGSTGESQISTGIIMQIGYTGATDNSGRKRDILLRPYYEN